MRAIFQESGNSPVVMHLLNNLDNHSDTMQLAIFKNLDGKHAWTLVYVFRAARACIGSELHFIQIT